MKKEAKGQVLRKIGNIMKDMKNFIMTIIIAVSLCAIAHADEPCLLWLDKDKIAPGKQAILSIVVPGAKDMPAPELPFVKGLAFKYQKTENIPAGPDGKTMSSTVYTYRIVAMKEGNYTIGPLSFDYENKRYGSGTVILNVSKEFIQAEAPASQERVPVSLQGHIYIMLDKPSGKILVNQKTPISVKLFSDWFDLEDITLSDISSPDLIIEKFQKAPSEIIIKDGIRYAVLEYKGSLLSPAPGVFTLDPVKVSLNIVRRRALPSGKMPDLLNDNEPFYDRVLGQRDSLSIDLTTEPFTIEVVDLPREGPPEGSRSAIGSEERPAGEGLVAIKTTLGTAKRKPSYDGNPLLSSWAILPLVFLGIASLVKKRSDFLRKHAEYARWLRGLRKTSADVARLEWLARSASPGDFYDAVFEVMRAYLGLRLFLPPQGITEKTIVDVLGDKIDDANVIDMIKGIFSDCHAARFTPLMMGKDDMAGTLSAVKKTLDYLNQRTYLLNI